MSTAKITANISAKKYFLIFQHTHDFPLYTEAIKFFNNPESMVRIAVRTLTLNVFRVQDKSMLEFIRDKTAAPYFSNLVWFIGGSVGEIDRLVKEGVVEGGSVFLFWLVFDILAMLPIYAKNTWHKI